MALLILIVICSYITFYSQATASHVNERIVNGTDADIEEFPYMVNLQYKSGFVCGGSIIDEYNILTAAHCCLLPSIYYSVGYGSTVKEGESIRVESIVVHEKFNDSTGYNDVAIVQLSAPLIFNESIQPVVLPALRNATPENAVAVLIGWGTDRPNGSLQTILQKVYIKVFTDKICEKIYEDVPTDHEYQICAGVPEGGKGQCNGDSGGPLVVDGRQVGIVSWSTKPCSSKGHPGVFTKVSTYIEWIYNNLKIV